jgi:hypothetical protein
MGKGVRTALLCLVFVAFAAGGYILGGKVFDKSSVEVVEEPVLPVVSTVPVLLEDGITAPKRANDGTFSFTAGAYVESEDQLMYILYADEACTQEVKKDLYGNFESLPALESETYYLRAQNVATKEFSEVVPVKGFAKPQLMMYQKITKEDLNNIINVNKNYSAAPKGFSHRIAPSFKVVVNGADAGDGNVAKIDEICAKVMMEIWSSVSIDEITYDSQNRMNKLVITVNY